MLRLFIAVFLTSLMPLLAQDINRAGHVFPKVAIPRAVRAAEIPNALGGRLPEIARWYGVTEEELRALVQRDRSIIADRSGRLAYACNGLVPPENAEAVHADAAPEPIVYPPELTFFLHSRPGAIRKIYLDFTGHTTSNTNWNDSFNGGNDFTTPRYDIDGDPAEFNSSELSRIQAIWKRVAEDFAPFEVDVTTEDPGLEALRRSPSTDEAYGIRVCIGGSSYDWYKRGAGGVAYIGSFNWTSDTPCFVFTAQLGNGNEKYTAEAASHEVGHTLGLYHDGKTDGTEYYTGHGNWAPIMGVGYDRDVVQWSKGEYADANNPQDDTAVMQNFGAPLRVDDVGDTPANAAPLGDISVSATGVIHTRTDRDVYQFNSGAGPVSFTTASPSASPNLDVSLTIYDISGSVVATSDPATLTATVNASVSPGTYFLAIEGTAPGDPLTSYNDYGSLGGYELTGFIQSTAENFVSVVASDSEASEHTQNTTPNPGTFTFTRLIVNPQPLVVPFTITGTGTSGTDFTMPTTVTIPGGKASASITLDVIDDSVGEGSETAIVVLSPSAEYSLSDAMSATVTILDNELPEVSILAAATDTFENSATPLRLTVHRDAKTPRPLTVNLAITGTGEPGVHFASFSTSVTIQPGEDMHEIFVQPLDNDVFNATRTVTVSVAPHAEYVPGFRNSATLRIFNEEPPPDPVKPSVTISAPKAKQRYAVPVTSLIAAGTAKDNLAVQRVQLRVNGGNWITADFNQGNWTADIAAHVLPGNNVLEARAEDEDANASAVAAVTFTVVQPRNLQVNVVGPGAVTPGTGTFEAMQPYALKARPGPGKIFAGWTGGLTGSGKVLYFAMPDADTEVTATFVDNPFSDGVIGKYTGLVKGPTLAPATSGLLLMNITRTGLATGKVWLGGKVFTLKGEFNGLGRMDAQILVRKQLTLHVGLNLDINPNGSQSVAGVITGPAGESAVQAQRAPFNKKTNPLGSDFARSYTFFLPPDAPSGTQETEAPLPDGDLSAARPQGYGVGILTISSSGVVKWAATLGDGSPATQSTTLDAQKRWPFFAPVYKPGGYLSGNVSHDPTLNDSDLRASLNWVKLRSPTDRFFPDGFRSQGHVLVGVNYTTPGKGQRVLPVYDATPNNAGSLFMDGGNLAEEGLNGTLTLLPNNATQTSALLEKLKIRIDPRSGRFTGSFTFPVTGQNTPIKGVVLQGKIGKGLGMFPGSTPSNAALQTGRVEFGPAVP